MNNFLQNLHLPFQKNIDNSRHKNQSSSVADFRNLWKKY
jgi:hypothetical protein